MSNRKQQRIIKELSKQYKYAMAANEFEGGRGYTIMRLMDEQLLQWRTLPRNEGIEAVNVVGESHHMKELQKKCFAAGCEVALVPEADNPYDKNALAVWDADEKYHVGYIPADESVRITKKMDNGEIERSIIMWETHKRKKRVSIRLLLVSPGASLHIPQQ